MTSYNLQAIIPPSLAALEKKEERKKVLARAAQIRKGNYERFLQRRAATYTIDAKDEEI